MFMTHVFNVMSNCHDKDTDRLWCIGLCQYVITKTSQCHICIKNVIIDHIMAGVMSVIFR